jgi:carbamoyltransferase
MTREQGKQLYLALGGSNHEFSVALMSGNDIRVAIEQERLSRRKHGVTEWFGDPFGMSIDYCLKAESLALSDVDVIVASDTIPARVKANFANKQVHLYPHHLCHAASAYLLQPYGTRAGILVYDGYGSICHELHAEQHREARETFSFYVFGPEGYECLGRTLGFGFTEEDEYSKGVTNSLGMLYEVVTAILGFNPMESGKTMGLASYGVPDYVTVLEEFVQYGESMASCFSCDAANPKLITSLEKILSQEHNSFRVRANLAASVQAVFEKTLFNCVRLFDQNDLDCICLAGGCALNTVANSYVTEKFGNSVPIVIPPHCGDTGLGFGALWLERFSSERQAPIITFRCGPASPAISRPGRVYSTRECHDAAYAYYPRLVHDPSIHSATRLAQILAGGAIVGVLSGRSEIGPRALGGRSIIADPRTIRNRERINRQLKRREPFRPLAPIILRTDYDKYFYDERYADPFMLKVAKANERCLREAPAVVHTDGTARVQVINDKENSFLVELLQAFKEITGTGILINTSFNRRGEPLIESPFDAIDAFLSMNLDGLYMEGNYYYQADSIVSNIA